MIFLLDTNICSTYLKRPSGLTHRFNQHMGRLAIPTIVLGELYAWAFGRDDSKRWLQILETQFLTEVEVLDFTAACSIRFGRVRRDLQANGITISPMDLLIGTVALVHDYTLVTHNVKDFKNIPDLRIVDWLAE